MQFLGGFFLNFRPTVKHLSYKGGENFNFGGNALHISKCRTKYIFMIIGHVAAALGPLACASRSARPPSNVLAAALGPDMWPKRSAP